MSTAYEGAPVEGVDVKVEITHRMTVCVGAPEIPEAVLREVLDHMRPGSALSVREVRGGSQRESEVAGYVLTVDLLGGAK